MDFPIPFVKMSGTGNDFIIIDNRGKLVANSEMVELAVQACRRGQSVGADGLLLIEDDPELDFAWRFFNSDGSEAEMCGNAARCVARLASLDGISGEELVFRTIAGPIQASVDGTGVTVQLTRPAGLEPRFDLELDDGEQIEAGFVDTGVPHTIVLLPSGNLEDLDVQETGRKIRFHPRFSPAGTNANFIEITGPGSVNIRTYERGVEAETLACGTGAVAAAIVATVRGLTTPPVSVTTQGGDVLIVHLDGKDPMAGDVHLEGNASLVYRGELTGETVSCGQTEKS
ncbi:MAG: diaminopimelate epimerase [bacterium]|nr:diaminopimelate epimerase [bacterium]